MSELLPHASGDALELALGPLWQRAQAGDEAAYRNALDLLARRLRAYFRRRLSGLPDEVEDLVQETLLALHLQRASHEAGLPVTSWAHAIAHHKLVDMWRRRGRREALHEPLDDLAEADHPAAPEPDATARRDVALLLEQLPAAQQQAIVLTKLEGLSMVEASARTGVSVAALKVQVHRGLKKLAALMQQPEP